MKIILSFFLLVSVVGAVQAQDVMDKMAKQVCHCLHKMKDKVDPLTEKMAICFESIFKSNMEEVKTYYHAQYAHNIDTQDLGNKVSSKMFKYCPDVYIGNKDSLATTYQKDPDVNCDDLHIGSYYYLIPKKEGGFDTTFATFGPEEYQESFGLRKYARLSLKWTGKCKFRLTFIESNDSFKNAFSTKGDTYEYEVVRNEPSMMVLKMVFDKKTFFAEYYKKK